jgi:hypothetical protein
MFVFSCKLISDFKGRVSILIIRKHAGIAVRKIVAGLGGHRNAVALVNELTAHIWNAPHVSVVSALSDTESGETAGGNRDITASGALLNVKADFIVKALITISKGTTYDTEGANELVRNSCQNVL